jgi:hypothetical protein
MVDFYLMLLILCAAFGAFCFNMGHRRAYRIVLKNLLRGQINFLSQRRDYLIDNRGKLSQDDMDKALYSYETIGQLVIGWYRYFRIVRDDKELRFLKEQIKESLREYLAVLEG